MARQRPDPRQRLAGARLGGAVDGGRARARRLRRRRAVAARTDVHGLLGRRLDLRRRPHRRGRHLLERRRQRRSWPLEPTPLDVPAAERETLAGYFAETGERMLCVCAVQKSAVTPIRASNPRRSHTRVNPQRDGGHPHPLHISHGPRLPTQPTQAGRRTERLLAAGEHRLLVLSPKKKLSLAMGIGGSGGATVGGSRLQWRVCFWHELLSCAGSADDPCRLRLCFVPQTARPPRCRRSSPRASPGCRVEPAAPTMKSGSCSSRRARRRRSLSCCTRCALPTRASGARSPPRRSRRRRSGNYRCSSTPPPAIAPSPTRRRRRRRRRRATCAARAARLLRALRHFCAYHDVALRPSRARAPPRPALHQRSKTGDARALAIARLPHTSPRARRPDAAPPLGPPRRHDAGAAAPAARLGHGGARGGGGDVVLRRRRLRPRGRRPPQRGLRDRPRGTVAVLAPPRHALPQSRASEHRVGARRARRVDRRAAALPRTTHQPRSRAQRAARGSDIAPPRRRAAHAAVGAAFAHPRRLRPRAALRPAAVRAPLRAWRGRPRGPSRSRTTASAKTTARMRSHRRSDAQRRLLELA